MTQETYQFLTKIHGISNDVCKYCWQKEVEVYQDNFEGCYDCWMRLCEPVISPPPE